LTFEIACNSCGTVLYSASDFKSPDRVLKAMGYKCKNKKCGVELAVDMFRVEVKNKGFTSSADSP
jgi:hypothetical protein